MESRGTLERELTPAALLEIAPGDLNEDAADDVLREMLDHHKGKQGRFTDEEESRELQRKDKRWPQAR